VREWHSCGCGPTVGHRPTEICHGYHDSGEEASLVTRCLRTTALVVIVLMTLGLPGAVAADAGGNADAAHSCQENYATWGFENRGDCVSFFAHGGTLGPTFETTCLGLDGTYFAIGQGGGGNTAPYCEWTGISQSDWIAAQAALEPFCPGQVAAGWALFFDPDWVGCI
jgi:hypothetical protein